MPWKGSSIDYLQNMARLLSRASIKQNIIIGLSIVPITISIAVGFQSF